MRALVFCFLLLPVSFFSCQKTETQVESEKGKKKTAELGLQELEDRCDAGDAKACTSLAVRYEKPVDGRINTPKALEVYQRACDLGDLVACNNLGMKYTSSLSPILNPEKGASMLDKACDGGLANSCFGLGMLYAAGQFVPRDLARAGEYYGRACDGGEVPACYELGKMLGKGKGMPQDKEGAKQLLEQACDDGYGWACVNDSWRRIEGKGIKKNMKDWKAWELEENRTVGDFFLRKGTTVTAYRDGPIRKALIHENHEYLGLEFKPETLFEFHFHGKKYGVRRIVPRVEYKLGGIVVPAKSRLNVNMREGYISSIENEYRAIDLGTDQALGTVSLYPGLRVKGYKLPDEQEISGFAVRDWARFYQSGQLWRFKLAKQKRVGGLLLKEGACTSLHPDGSLEEGVLEEGGVIRDKKFERLDRVLIPLDGRPRVVGTPADGRAWLSCTRPLLSMPPGQ